MVVVQKVIENSIDWAYEERESFKEKQSGRLYLTWERDSLKRYEEWRFSEFNLLTARGE